jgi:hypothetical protein
MAKITFVYICICIQHTKINFNISNNKAYYFVNVFIYQLFYVLFFHDNPFLYWKLGRSKFIALIDIENYDLSYNTQNLTL